ncbi:hypothetical protein L3X38_000509 [Prunus dulcis]|uniref:RNase H type-1 domain-containing protein n=1 Tax=Prunus dulcis TaxID=3755 RepID=A0AAD4WSD0_PRUDU|nr:hypothetical protein L3X38_000509 [Prunus dulcis]
MKVVVYTDAAISLCSLVSFGCSLVPFACSLVTRRSHRLFNLIHSCKAMLLRDCECSISHIYREQNIAADHMAHMGQSSNLGYHVVDLSPPIVSLLANDSVKMTTARLVPV